MAQSREEYIKQNLSIPKYFELIILEEMDSYYYGSNTDFDLRPVVRCPLHNEDTGSFRFHSDTDSFYCWGCARGGDVINLHKHYMLLNHNTSVSHEKAVDFLYELAKNQTVDDRSIGKYKKASTTEVEEEKINTDTDLLRFNIEVNRYLRYIGSELDKEASVEAMRTLYNYRDCVYGQGMSVLEALKEIKGKILA